MAARPRETPTRQQGTDGTGARSEPGAENGPGSGFRTGTKPEPGPEMESGTESGGPTPEQGPARRTAVGQLPARRTPPPPRFAWYMYASASRIRTAKSVP
ncbi:hypothetical protein Q0Z83_004490 [Actinoplanes sichuanensis]|nr:hypothetical protein Q0Z83_004490 [Actinoplanes sichuanensis]